MSSSFPVARFPALSQENADATPVSTNKPNILAEISDDSLLAQIAKGNEEALAILFRRYARLVWSIAERILKDKAEAEDVMQEVFLSIYRKAAVFDSAKGPARTLIVHMTYQRAFTYRTHLSARHAAYALSLEKNSSQSIVATSSFYDESIEAHFGREILQKALAEMSEDQRETIRLFFFEGYTLDEISMKLGQCRGNVKHHYYRGLGRLRRCLPGNRYGE